MFGEGPGTKEEMIKAEAEMAIGSFGNESEIVKAKEKEAKREKVEREVERKDMETFFNSTTGMAECFVKLKKEKSENA